MKSSQQIDRHQQQCVRQQLDDEGPFAFFNLLSGPELLATVERLLPEHRERLFPPTQALSMFLTQSLTEKGSCRKVVTESAVSRECNGLPGCSTNTSAYVRARAKLPLELPMDLATYSGWLIEQNAPEHWQWRGRRVRLVDGTTVKLPDTEANQGKYPQPSSQGSGLGYPLCRLVGLFSLATGALLDCADSPCVGKGSDEQSSRRTMLDMLERGEILMGDAFYATYFLLGELDRGGIDAVFEQNGARQRSTDFRRGEKLGAKDHIIELHKPKERPEWMSQEDYQEAPQSIKVRELRVGKKTLVTTMLNPKEVSRSALNKLYGERWHVELDFRNLKTTMGMEMMRCQTPEMALKEIWVNLLAYNLIRLLMCQAATRHRLKPRQISFTHAIDVWLAYRQNGSRLRKERLFEMIAEQKVGNRPGRVEPRARKQRPKPFPLLMEERSTARARIIQHGHL